MELLNMSHSGLMQGLGPSTACTLRSSRTDVKSGARALSYRHSRTGTHDVTRSHHRMASIPHTPPARKKAEKPQLQQSRLQRPLSRTERLFTNLVGAVSDRDS